MALTRIQEHQIDNIGVSHGGLAMAAGTTAQRPGSALPGTLRFNTDIGELEEFNGNIWTTVSDTPHLQFIGDVQGAGNVGNVTTLTLTTVNSNVGTFGSNITVPVITINEKGLITSVTTSSISAPGSTDQAQVLALMSLRV